MLYLVRPLSFIFVGSRNSKDALAALDCSDLLVFTPT
jgi:hypothetical protein